MKKNWKLVYQNSDYAVKFDVCMGYKIVKKPKWKGQNCPSIIVNPDKWTLASYSFEGRSKQITNIVIDQELVNAQNAVFRHWKQSGRRSWRRNAAVRELDAIEFKQKKALEHPDAA